MIRYITGLLCSLAVGMFLFAQTNTYSLVLSWDPVTDPNVTDTKLFYGTASRDYPFSIDGSTGTQVTVPNLAPGIVYYFGAKNYDSYGDDSCYSNEVVYVKPVAGTYTATFIVPKAGSYVIQSTPLLPSGWTTITQPIVAGPVGSQFSVTYLITNSAPTMFYRAMLVQ